MGGSDKHLRDITSMLRISPEAIDVERLRTMAVQHGVGDLLDRVLRAVTDV
jgi:hypothetical protein